MDRGERRARTARVARHQHELRQRMFLGRPVAALGPTTSDHPHFWAKRSALGCNCRGRKHGNPRVSGGLCGMGGRDAIYELRNRTRELRVLIRRGWTDWEAEEVTELEFHKTPK